MRKYNPVPSLLLICFSLHAETKLLRISIQTSYDGLYALPRPSPEQDEYEHHVVDLVSKRLVHISGLSLKDDRSLDACVMIRAEPFSSPGITIGANIQSSRNSRRLSVVIRANRGESEEAVIARFSRKLGRFLIDHRDEIVKSDISHDGKRKVPGGADGIRSK
jgi:hypothetical protein